MVCKLAWSGDGSRLEAHAAVGVQQGLRLCQGLLLPGCDAEEVLSSAGPACLAALHHAQQAGLPRLAQSARSKLDSNMLRDIALPGFKIAAPLSCSICRVLHASQHCAAWL